MAPTLGVIPEFLLCIMAVRVYFFYFKKEPGVKGEFYAKIMMQRRENTINSSVLLLNVKNPSKTQTRL